MCWGNRWCESKSGGNPAGVNLNLVGETAVVNLAVVWRGAVLRRLVSSGLPLTFFPLTLASRRNAERTKRLTLILGEIYFSDFDLPMILLRTSMMS